MIIDTSKRYRFLGLDYEFKVEGGDYWYSSSHLIWTEVEFQHFADRGAVEEIIQRIPRRATVRIKFRDDGLIHPDMPDYLRQTLGNGQAESFRNAVFEGELVEVLDNE